MVKFDDLARNPRVCQVFRGLLASRVQCSHCRRCSDTNDPFETLSVQINHATDVQGALNDFTSKETLDGQNQYFCEACNSKQNVRSARHSRAVSVRLESQRLQP